MSVPGALQRSLKEGGQRFCALSLPHTRVSQEAGPGEENGCGPLGEVLADPAFGLAPGDCRGDLPCPGVCAWGPPELPEGGGEPSSSSMSSMKASIQSVSRSFIISSSPASGIASCASAWQVQARMLTSGLPVPTQPAQQPVLLGPQGEEGRAAQLGLWLQLHSVLVVPRAVPSSTMVPLQHAEQSHGQPCRALGSGCKLSPGRARPAACWLAVRTLSVWIQGLPSTLSTGSEGP